MTLAPSAARLVERQIERGPGQWQLDLGTVSLLLFHGVFEMSQLPLRYQEVCVVLKQYEEQPQRSVSSSVGTVTLPT